MPASSASVLPPTLGGPCDGRRLETWNRESDKSGDDPAEHDSQASGWLNRKADDRVNADRATSREPDRPRSGDDRPRRDRGPDLLPGLLLVARPLGSGGHVAASGPDRRRLFRGPVGPPSERLRGSAPALNAGLAWVAWTSVWTPAAA